MENINTVAKDMKTGFDKLEKKIDCLRIENSADNKEITTNCSERRAEIYERIETNRQGIEQLDKKFFRLFLIGSGFGFVAGVVVTVIITTLSKGAAG